jgi:hypothetical protein
MPRGVERTTWVSRGFTGAISTPFFYLKTKSAVGHKGPWLGLVGHNESHRGNWANPGPGCGPAACLPPRQEGSGSGILRREKSGCQNRRYEDTKILMHVSDVSPLQH